MFSKKSRKEAEPKLEKSKPSKPDVYACCPGPPGGTSPTKPNWSYCFFFFGSLRIE
jgi:hypothetical protein